MPLLSPLPSSLRPQSSFHNPHFTIQRTFMTNRDTPPSPNSYPRPRGLVQSERGISTRCSSTSTAETIVPDATKFNEEGKRVGVLFGSDKRFSLLMALGLGGSSETLVGGSDTTQSSKASDYDSDDSDSDSFVVYYDALLAPSSSSRVATSGYDDYDVSKKRLSAALGGDSHQSDTSSGTPEPAVSAIKRSRVFEPKESQSRSKRDTIFDAFVLGGQVAPVSRSQGPWQDGYKKLVKNTRPRQDSIFADRPKSGENVREYLLEYQSQCIKAPPLKPLRLRGSIQARTSDIKESKPTATEAERKENNIVPKGDDIESRGDNLESKDDNLNSKGDSLNSKGDDIESKSDDNSIDSGLSDLFKDVQALYAAPATPFDVKTDLVFDAVMAEGKLAPVSRDNGLRQVSSTDTTQKPGRGSTKPSESSKGHGVLIDSILLENFGPPVLPLSPRRRSGSQDSIAPSTCAAVPDRPVPISIREEKSRFDNDDEYEEDYALTVIDEDEDQVGVIPNPFEFDYVMVPGHQTMPEIEPATANRVEDHEHDTDADDDEHDVWADPFEYSYLMSPDQSTTTQATDDGNNTSCVFNCLFDSVFSSAGLLVSPGLTESSLPSSRESTPPATPVCADLVISFGSANSPRLVRDNPMVANEQSAEISAC
ncbi:hypothetical protein RhiJN_03547 [Ceratobasidium sp. AG-Ba]|nr:hypothetical protein RhiJN_03547 [Ceratobasidium sp. AG-Ba]QRW04435.1 hypothetical protein RhiLY_03434 [Ceratobasidium sp. AG-Ba]